MKKIFFVFTVVALIFFGSNQTVLAGNALYLAQFTPTCWYNCCSAPGICTIGGCAGNEKQGYPCNDLCQAPSDCGVAPTDGPELTSPPPICPSGSTCKTSCGPKEVGSGLCYSGGISGTCCRPVPKMTPFVPSPFEIPCPSGSTCKTTTSSKEICSGFCYSGGKEGRCCQPLPTMPRITESPFEIPCPEGSTCKTTTSSKEICSGFCYSGGISGTCCQAVPTMPVTVWPPQPSLFPFPCQTEGQTRCVSNAIYEKCIGGQWVIVKNCMLDKQTCVEASGCSNIDNSCDTPGQIGCYGNYVAKCGNDKKWVASSQCNQSELCIAGQCTHIPPQCPSGQKKCEGNFYIVCENNYWHLKEDCSLTNKTCTTNGCLGQAPTYVPPTSPSCQKSQGDANCDGRTDMLDFENWRQEYIAGATTKTADFNNDGKVDLADFEIWRKGFFEPQRPTNSVEQPITPPGQPTATEVPEPTTPPGQPTATPNPTATATPKPTNTPGPGAWHWGCVGTVCDIVSGAGTDTCRIDEDCEEPTATPKPTATPAKKLTPGPTKRLTTATPVPINTE
jgi:hypothetical protein